MIGFAATVQFTAVEHVGHGPVASRMLLAGERGAGEVVVDGRTIRIEPTTIVVMPWRHHVAYHPDADDPFLVYGVHLVPWHGRDEPVELVVPHRADHRLAGVGWRADAPLGIDAGPAPGRTTVVLDARDRPSLKSLLVHICQVWDRGTPPVETARILGRALTAELEAPSHPTSQHDTRLPLRLRRCLTWITADLARPVSLADLARAADCSPSTVTRLFRRHLGRAPLAWVQQARMVEAVRLLQTTGLPVTVVAARVGIDDPNYFSRRFTAELGCSPTTWRHRWAAP